MFANKVDPVSGKPLCVCKKPVSDNRDENALVSGSKGLVILHETCRQELITLSELGAW